MKKIVIDDEVWNALKKHADPFEDTPNDVLRRLLSLDTESESGNSSRSVVANGDEEETNYRAQGEEFRRRYRQHLREREGVSLEHEHGIVYQGPNEKKVAIATASERRPGRWFLGAAKSIFTESGRVGLILLCAKGDQLFDFYLPHNEMVRLAPLLDRGGQLKFNVVVMERSRDGNGYELKIPSGSPLDITNRLHAFPRQA